MDAVNILDENLIKTDADILIQQIDYELINLPIVCVIFTEFTTDVVPSRH